MKGVTAFIKKEATGTIRLVFNDVVATSDGDEPDWNHETFFTHNDYDSSQLEGLALSEKQYAEIGENLIFRLLALNGNFR